MDLRMLGSGLLTGVLVALVTPVGACLLDPCHCGDPQVFPLPTDTEQAFTDLRVADWYDGGDSDEWDWDETSPWGDVLAGELHLDDGVLTFRYRTAEGTFLVEVEEVEPED